MTTRRRLSRAAAPRAGTTTVAGLSVSLALVLFALCPGSAPTAAEIRFDSSTFGALRARSIGPAAMSGRISALDAVPGETLTVYGGLQDNGTWKGPSRSPGGIENRDWQVIGYGDGFHAHVDRVDPDIVYVEYRGGKLMRRNQATGELEEKTAEFDALAADGLESLALQLEKKKLAPLKLMTREEWESGEE